MDWITTTPKAALMVVISTILIYIAIVGLTRLFGIRSFSKMSGFDFAVTVAFGSILASVVMAKDPAVIQGIIATTSLFAIQAVTAVWRKNSDTVEDIVSNEARLIMANGKMIEEQMKAARISEDDLFGKLREANVFRMEDVAAVIAETTGDVSVLHMTGDNRCIDYCILEGVIGAEKYSKTNS